MHMFWSYDSLSVGSRQGLIRKMGVSDLIMELSGEKKLEHICDSGCQHQPTCTVII